MRAFQRIRNLILHLPLDSATANVSYTRAPENVVECSREVTVRDLERMHPDLFVRNN